MISFFIEIRIAANLSFENDFFCGAVTGNVLLLRNNLNLSPDIAEISQEKLLSLVAERLIDSNSNVNVISFLFYAWLICLLLV